MTTSNPTSKIHITRISPASFTISVTPHSRPTPFLLRHALGRLAASGPQRFVDVTLSALSKGEVTVVVPTELTVADLEFVGYEIARKHAQLHDLELDGAEIEVAE